MRHPQRKFFKQVFNNSESIDALEQTTTIVNLIEDLYSFLGLEQQYKEDKWSTILRGLLCGICGDFGNPWFVELVYTLTAGKPSKMLSMPC